MTTAYIVDACRTAIGKKKGTLSEVHPADLGATVINALLDRNKLNPNLVDDVIIGCVDQVGSQAGNLGRNVVLSSKLPETVPGVVVDRQCGSSQQALHFAAQAVMSGTQDIVIAGGVENMTMVPIGASVVDGLKAGHGHPYMSEGMNARYDGFQFSQFEGAEMLAEKYQIPRQHIDKMAIESHRRAHDAIKAGKFKKEIVPFNGFDTDEGVRWPADEKKIGAMKPLKEGGVITAVTSSQISDGASAVLIMNEAGLKKSGLKPLAKIKTLSVVGDDPKIMLQGPIPATQAALKKAGLSIKDIDVYEINEAFATVPAAWCKALGADPAKLNVNGGAMALGHPLGATGTKLMATLVYELERRQGRYGLLAICEGGGTANCTIIERIPQGGQSKL